MKSTNSKIFCFLCSLSVAFVATSVYGQTTPAAERGLSSDTAYQMGNVDHINLFSGNLSVTLPLGKSYPLGPSSSYGLMLVYNSNAWVRTEEVCGDGGGGGTDYSLPEPDFRDNAGFGWQVNLGSLYPKDTPPYNTDISRWLFVTPDGGEHLFSDELHPGYPAVQDPGVTFSGDSTYLRMQASGCSTTPSGTSGCRTIESPDGSRYEFHRYGSGALDWKLTTYSDAFGNDLTVTYSGGDWTLTDSHGRSHMVDFDAQGRVDEVRMEGVGTGTVTYDLQYGSATLIDRQEYARPAFCVPAAPGDEVGVTFLDRLVMPDGSFYGFSYFDNDLVAQDTLSGGLATLRLPTGGEVATPIGEISSSASPHRAAAILGCAPTAWPRAACSRIRALRPRVPGPTI